MPTPPHLPDESHRPTFSRRAFLTVSTLSTLSAAAYYAHDRLPSAAILDRDSPAPAALPPDALAYRDFLATHPLRHLTPEEIIRPHLKMRSGVSCGLPPREYWNRILPTLRVADELRARLGVPLSLIVSAYRSPAYNAKCPGAAKWSQHIRNRALDLRFGCAPDQAFAAALKLRDEGFFTGGLGLYQNFIHLDTRKSNATWGA